MLLCTPLSACGNQIDPLPCEPTGVRQTEGQFISTPRFRPVPSPRARARSNRRAKGLIDRGPAGAQIAKVIGGYEFLASLVY
jgi:hypothetical protein